MTDSQDKIKMLDEYLETGKPIYSHKSYGEESPIRNEEIPETERGLMHTNTGLELDDKPKISPLYTTQENLDTEEPLRINSESTKVSPPG